MLWFVIIKRKMNSHNNQWWWWWWWCGSQQSSVEAGRGRRVKRLNIKEILLRIRPLRAAAPASCGPAVGQLWVSSQPLGVSTVYTPLTLSCSVSPKDGPSFAKTLTFIVSRSFSFILFHSGLTSVRSWQCYTCFKTPCGRGRDVWWLVHMYVGLMIHFKRIQINDKGNVLRSEAGMTVIVTAVTVHLFKGAASKCWELPTALNASAKLHVLNAVYYSW